MSSISDSIHLQKKPVVCPHCGSTARIGRDLCLRCMLFLGIPASGDTSETLDDLFGEIDVEDAEDFVGKLRPTFSVVGSARENTPHMERQCAAQATASTESQSEGDDQNEKLTF